jgi:hypothetical protein
MLSKIETAQSSDPTIISIKEELSKSPAGTSSIVSKDFHARYQVVDGILYVKVKGFKTAPSPRSERVAGSSVDFEVSTAPRPGSGPEVDSYVVFPREAQRHNISAPRHVNTVPSPGFRPVADSTDFEAQRHVKTVPSPLIQPVAGSNFDLMAQRHVTNAPRPGSRPEAGNNFKFKAQRHDEFEAQRHDELEAQRHDDFILVPYLPKSLVTEILEYFHDLPEAGHMGIKKTQEAIKRRFYWHNMNTEIKRYVKTCRICQETKVERLKPKGLMGNVPIATSVFETIYMDFIGPFPPSRKTEISIAL